MFDAIFVGSGINSLVGAALLAKAGWKVCLLERSEWFGGAIRTAEITEPGFVHDLFSAWHPLFAGSEAYAVLKQDLQARGLEYLNTTYPTGALFPDGSGAFLSTSPQENEIEFERLGTGDGAAWRGAMADAGSRADLGFGLLGTELWSGAGAKLAWRGARRLGVRGTLDYGSELLAPSRAWLEQTFSSYAARGLLAPWVLHMGLGPETAGSALMNKLIALALQTGGMPVPRGGGALLADALVRLILDGGGEVQNKSHVDSVEICNGRALGVRCGGRQIAASRAVVCNVTPQQLYLQLLEGRVVPGWARAKAANYRYGRADMQIHLALSDPPRWPGDDTRWLRTAIVHMNDGLDGVSRAVNEAERGLLPADPTVVVGQPLAVDPSRAPAGRWIFWLQLQELPRQPLGDAAGTINVEGGWTEALRERFADRVIEKLARQIPNLMSSIRRRVVFSPADLERANINLVGGDPYSGSCAPDQFFLWRPAAGLGHRTPIARLYHIGASTHPGPGLHGTSGLLVAKQLLRAAGWRRMLSRKVPVRGPVAEPKRSVAA